ncbi:patched domain-containing protein 3-like isoform X2 [Hyalella azteca]|uniref:Patched domain-containing protein 3-like isoform X2 n=1 Tax=Hyalella azteca TaxID=294128 RepID=A0A979FVS4_HYAAZ|nr:patched domain-containing protein 3-like isoform X2 [Hyalella azteca]
MCKDQPTEMKENALSGLGYILTKCFPDVKWIQERKFFFFETFDSILSKVFFKLGELIADYPKSFIVIPVLITVISVTGFLRMNWIDDPEFLFSPLNGRARQERDFIEGYFKLNYTDSFNEDRLTRNDPYVQLGITMKDSSNMIDQEVMNKIHSIDGIVRNFEFHDEEGKSYTYNDICAKAGGKCVRPRFLDLTVRIHEVKTRKLNLTFPVMINPTTFDNYIFPFFIAGVKLYPENSIMSAEAIKLSYWASAENQEIKHLSNLWEEKFLAHFIKGLGEPSLNIAMYHSRTAEEEIRNNTLSVFPYLTVTVFVMTVFCLASVTLGDCVRSKTWLGLVAIISSALASLTAFGVLMHCGVPMIGMNMAAPFLMLGIGIDDAFVMLSAWHRTRPQDSVRERMAQTYAESAVSISITSITNMISFFIGTFTYFASVRVFCLYLGISVLMTYVWHITLFGACLALSGRAEKQQLHNITCKRVKSSSESAEESAFYRRFCAGGVAASDPSNPDDNQPQAAVILFRDYVAYCLNLPVIQGVVVVAFAAYLAVAVYGCTTINDGMQLRKTARYDSYSIPFYDFTDKYFSSFAYRPMIVFTGNITYSDPANERQLLEFVEKVESHEFIGDEFYTDCWLRQWTKYMARNGKYQGLNNSDEKTYIYNLQESFLSGDINRYRADIVFSEDNSRIVASRCLVQSVNVMNAINDRRLMQDLRQWADESKFNVTVYHPMFIYFDHLTIVRSTILKAIAYAALTMVLICVIFIPNPISSLCVGVAIVSIETGVIGYMSLWGVNFDVVSMIQLIMCIGFSVDFTAHISYSYLAAKVGTPEERVRECMTSLGLPVMQGALSTLIGILPLMLIPSYMFTTFFKTVFLVIFFGTIHGIFLMPVFLSMFESMLRNGKVRVLDEERNPNVNESREMASIRNKL